MRLLLLTMALFLTASCVRRKPPIIVAARRSDAAAVRALVDGGANVNTRDAFGMAALHWAVLHGDADTAEYLIAEGADIELRNDDGCTPILKATTPECVATLHKHGAKIDAVEECGRGIIHWATGISSSNTQHNVQSIIDYALACGMDVNREDGFRRTALDYAVMRDDKEVAAFLLSLGCHPGSRGVPPYPDWATNLVQQMNDTGTLPLGYRGRSVLGAWGSTQERDKVNPLKEEGLDGKR